LICGDYGNILEECGGKVRLGKVKEKKVESVPTVSTPKVESVTKTETQVMSTGEQYIPNGRYKVIKVVDEKGYVLVWEKSLVLDISSVGNHLYMVKITDLGLVNNQSIDCSEPLVYSMSIDSNGRQTDQKILKLSGIKTDIHRVKG